MKIQVPFIPWPFPSWVRALTIWPFTFYEPGVQNEPCVVLHENYHLKDQLRWLVLPWFIVYLVVGVYMVIARKPTDWHPMERKAYRLQRYCEAGLQPQPGMATVKRKVKAA